MSQLLWNVCFGELIRRVTEDCLFFSRETQGTNCSCKSGALATFQVRAKCVFRTIQHICLTFLFFVIRVQLTLFIPIVQVDPSRVEAAVPCDITTRNRCMSMSSSSMDNSTFRTHTNWPHKQETTCFVLLHFLSQLPSMATFKAAATKDVWNNRLTLLFYM